MQSQLTARLAELNKQLESGAAYQQKLRAQLENLEAQILRIQGAKMLVEELLKDCSEKGHSQVDNENSQSDEANSAN
jgi:hypothetical protein